MCLKGYRLWVMGQLDSNVQSPTDVQVVRAEVLQHLWAGLALFTSRYFAAVKTHSFFTAASMSHVTNPTPPGNECNPTLLSLTMSPFATRNICE
jgi:hypothetical protein